MSSIPPALHTFWSGSLVMSPSFGVLQCWSEILQTPMPEAMQPPRPASHISAALRRVIDAPSAQPISDADPIARSLDLLQDHRDYCGTTLRLAADRLVGVLEERDVPEGPPEALKAAQDGLRDVALVFDGYQRELLQLGARLNEAERSNRLPSAASEWILEVAGRLYTRLVRAHGQLERVTELLGGRVNAAAAAEIRRRFSWVISLHEFSRPLEWSRIPVSELIHIPDASLGNRFETGLVLLDQFREGVSEKEIALYERAATSPVLGGKDIAFDWQGVLGADLVRREALEELRKKSSQYDVLVDDFAHQFDRLRIPYRHAQALVLGLWAGGNRLRLYTEAGDHAEGYASLFNDFPLLKVAFEFVPPESAAEAVTHEDLTASRHYMDAPKRRFFGERHFRKPDGRLFLEMLQNRVGMKNPNLASASKIPFPDFPFDVLVEGASSPVSGLRALGFGDRWLPAVGDAARLLTDLEARLANPPTGLSAIVAEWLDRWEIP